MAKKRSKKTRPPAPIPEKAPPKKRIGRPRVVINEDELRTLARVNCTYEEIATYFGIAKSTLSKRYRTTIEKHRSENKTSLRRTQFAMAIGKPNAAKPNGYDRLPNITMLIWLGKQELGQREPDKGTPEKVDDSARVVTGKDLLEKKLVIKRTVVVRNADDG